MGVDRAWRTAAALIALSAACTEAKAPRPPAHTEHGASSGTTAGTSDVAASSTSAAPPLLPTADNEAVLAALDTNALTGTERDELLRALDTTPSPCGEAFTVATCIAENRSCESCRPAAQEAIRYVHQGEDASSIRGFIDLRFGTTLGPVVSEAGAPSIGPLDAKVKVVEFVDFQCPVCGMMAPLVKKAIEAPNVKGRVRLVFKNFPLEQHVHAKDAAAAGYAADAQGKFWPMATAMLGHQDSLDLQGLESLAKQAGCDVPAWRKVFAADTTRARVEADRKLAIDLGIESTPTIYIDRRKWVPMGTATYDEQIANWIARDLSQ